MERRHLLWIFLTCELVNSVLSEGVLNHRLSIASTTTTTSSYQPERCPLCYCGLPNKPNRIGGELENQVNEYPWAAFLLYKGRFYCDASVINNKYLLTSAHCVDGFQKQFMTVRTSENLRNSPNKTIHQDFSIEEIFKHTNYSTKTLDNNIALIKIDGEIEFNHKMKPVCLAEKAKNVSGEIDIVIGWEDSTRGGPVSTTLRKALVSILSDAECRATKHVAQKITDNLLCTAHQERQKDSCQGEPGNLFHIQSDGLHRIVGVVSWAKGCPGQNFPDIYTRVDRYINWIMRNTEDACYCSEDKNLRF